MQQIIYASKTWLYNTEININKSKQYKKKATKKDKKMKQKGHDKL